MSTKRLFTALLAFTALTQTGMARAQSPARPPSRIIVPFTPGGASDILARIIAPKLQEAWGHPVVVENKPGGGGHIGVELVAKSGKDSGLLVLSDLGTLAIGPSLQRLTYDLHRDLRPVTIVSFSPYLLVVHPQVPVKNVSELIAYAKANPGKLNYATAGLGTNPHLAGLWFASRLGIDWVYVPSKGGSQALNDMIAGQADVFFNSLFATNPQVKNGKLRLLAVSSPKRLPAYPDTPAVTELIPDFVTGSWQGMLMAGDTPPELVARVNRDVVKALQGGDVRAKLDELGAYPIANTPAEMDRFLRDERERWAKVIRDANLKIEQ
jgi:tripartite-type tricarboxylate transporter receptor subunit TctC